VLGVVTAIMWCCLCDVRFGYGDVWYEVVVAVSVLIFVGSVCEIVVLQVSKIGCCLGTLYVLDEFWPFVCLCAFLDFSPLFFLCAGVLL